MKYLDPARPGRIAVTARLDRPPRHLLCRRRQRPRASRARDHARVFELFRRSGAQDRPGEGIGLAHVKALVRSLGGRIDVTLDAGRGHHVRRDAAARARYSGRWRPCADAPWPPNEHGGPVHPVSIVMIEDDEGHARLIERNIRRAGVNNEIMPFRDGTSALDIPARRGRLGRGERGAPPADPARPQPARHDRHRHPGEGQGQPAHPALARGRADHHRRQPRDPALLRSRRQRLHHQAGRTTRASPTRSGSSGCSSR